jgi:carboxyl-terminal processing protease
VDISYMVDDEIGYIKVSRFAATTYIEFKEALMRLNEAGMKKLVLDLTDNPGGYMDRAVDMADEFLAGKQLIVYTEGKETRYNDRHESSKDGDFETGALIVLINEGTASAPEIVTGALQDHDRALVVGRRSFGKGLVQRPIALTDGSEIWLTISRYYTPSGRCIQKSYTNGLDEYAHDYQDRFENGELFVQDSMKINDTVVYKTDKGRSVYAGGGIVPDIFVPIDTSGNNIYVNRLFRVNAVPEFALLYAETNRKKLEAGEMKPFIDSFEVTDAMLHEVYKLGKSKGLTDNTNLSTEAAKKLKLLVKARIGRSIWGDAAFYPIINTENEILTAALGQFDKAEELLNQ